MGGVAARKDWYYLHVDNLAILSRSHDFIERALVDFRLAFSQKGLHVKRGPLKPGPSRRLGVELSGEYRLTTITSRCYWRLRLALHYALSLRDGLTGHELDIFIC